MLQRYRTLRVCRWTGTVSCILLLTLCVGSEWYWTTLVWRMNHGEILVTFADGIIIPNWLSPSGSSDPASQSRIGEPRLECEVSPAALGAPSLPGDTEIPIWLVIPVLLVPTLLLWRRSTRYPRQGFCPQCDYDLTGITSGICPECGCATKA